MFWYVTKSLVFITIFYALVKFFQLEVSALICEGFCKKASKGEVGLKKCITGKEFLDYLLDKIGAVGYSVVKSSESSDSPEKIIADALPGKDYDKIVGNEIVLLDESFETITFDNIMCIMNIIITIIRGRSKIASFFCDYHNSMRPILSLSLFIIPLGLIKNELFGINILYIGIIMLAFLFISTLIVSCIDTYFTFRVLRMVEESDFFTSEEMQRIRKSRVYNLFNNIVFAVILPLSDIYFMIYYLLFEGEQGAEIINAILDEEEEEDESY